LVNRAPCSFRSFLTFLFGLCSTVFLTELGKISSGVLRPNFIDLCRPNVTCGGSGDITQHAHDSYVCQGHPDAESDGRKSFPSGHASVVSFVAVFAAVYLQQRPSRSSSAVLLLRPVIQGRDSPIFNNYS
jgi:phosphatidate phosphatase